MTNGKSPNFPPHWANGGLYIYIYILTFIFFFLSFNKNGPLCIIKANRTIFALQAWPQCTTRHAPLETQPGTMNNLVCSTSSRLSSNGHRDGTLLSTQITLQVHFLEVFLHSQLPPHQHPACRCS